MSEKAVHPVQHDIMCQLSLVIFDDEYEVIWEKEISLPFLPREGDRLEMDGFSYLVVTWSAYSVEDRMAEVFIRRWQRCTGSWEKEKQQMEVCGWVVCDCGERLPPCLRESIAEGGE